MTKLAQRASYLLPEGPEAVQEAWPEVLEQWTVNLLQTVFGAGVHADIQLGNWHQAPGNYRAYGGERIRAIQFDRESESEYKN